MKRKYDSSDALSIFQYSGRLVNHTLSEIISEDNPEISLDDINQDGKGGLGVLVEKYFFGYAPNNNPLPDFNEAGLELKVSPLKRIKKGDLAIKERLVCDMIDYMTIINEEFENSKFHKKSALMLILFYLHIHGYNKRDLRFLYSVLWQLKGKDLSIIKNDFIIIREKIRQGKAHELSEGDTMYLGACRKGQKGQSPRQQPCSEILANPRAFSLKTAYMRTILDYVKSKNNGMTSNLLDKDLPGIEMVTSAELASSNFEDVVIGKIMKYKGMNSEQIQISNNVKVDLGKNKNYRALCSIFNVSNLNKADEIVKSGIIIKTIRLNKNGIIKESMSFKNIDYGEVYNASDWLDSEWYDIATSRFLFVVFRESVDGGGDYLLDKAFFWTMSPDDLDKARQYWMNIKHNVMSDTLQDNLPGIEKSKINSYWKLSDDNLFHVRPKAGTSHDKHYSPVSGVEVPRKAYWLNSSLIKQKVKQAYGDQWNELFNTHK